MKIGGKRRELEGGPYFVFLKYKKNFLLRKYKKSFFLRKYKNFFNVRARNFSFQKYKDFFFLAPNLTTYHMLGVSETQATTFLEYNGLCYFLTSTQIENV